MIEKGMFLYFAPPKFADGTLNEKKQKRLMLVINKNDIDNTLTLVNISKVKGKPNCFTYNFNVLIRNYNPPLPLPSFAKINNNYILDNFNGLEQFIYKNGIKLNDIEFDNIINRYRKYIKNNKVELISFTKDELLQTNDIILVNE